MNKEEKLYKERIKNKKFQNFDEDLLIDDSRMIPSSQKWFVIASADLDPNMEALRVIHDLDIFIRKGIKIMKIFINNKEYNSNFLMRYFNIFRSNENNQKILDKSFKKKYPKYSAYRMFKFYGAFSDKKMAQKKADLISKRTDMKCVRIYNYQSGFWVPFHPTGSYLTNIKYREKNMQNLMDSSINNQIRVENDFKNRRMILIEKERRKKKGIDGPFIKGKKEKEIDLTDEELEFEFQKYNPFLENELIIKDSDEEKKKLKPLKDLVEKEIEIGNWNINEEIISKLNLDEKYVKKHKENIKIKKKNT
jgi:hypothetical protein